MKAVFDTNILIDYLNGIEDARDMMATVDLKLVSVITYIEVLVGAKDVDEEKAIRGFLGAFEIVDLSADIGRETIAVRRRHRLKIPDAIVYATARTEGCVLVTRNTKDMKPSWPDILVPYEL